MILVLGLLGVGSVSGGSLWLLLPSTLFITTSTNILIFQKLVIFL